MWTYHQKTGALVNPEGQQIARGYAGHGVGRNNPTMQDVPDIGPPPCGIYDVGAAFDSPRHGKYCLPLEPRPENKMYGRSGFLMHGDEVEHPGMGLASHGCIIQAKMIRMLVGTSNDRVLEVVP